MNDRELLELAAKAAGICGDYSERAEAIVNEDGYWMPLKDDGDALRLAVNLRITIAMHADAIAAMHTASGRSWCESYDGDKQAATRRAIVCAAAAIGQAVK